MRMMIKQQELTLPSLVLHSRDSSSLLPVLTQAAVSDISSSSSLRLAIWHVSRTTDKER